jgi:hypothetical protein
VALLVAALGSPRAAAADPARPSYWRGDPSFPVLLAEALPPDTSVDEEDDSDTLSLPQQIPVPGGAKVTPQPTSTTADSTKTTQEILPLPGSSAAPPETLFASSPRGIGPPAPPPERKERKGVFGIHPIAILLGLAVLQFFVVRMVD